MQIGVLAVLMLLCVPFASSQTLKRLGGIGALFVPVNDSVASANGLTQKKGLLVTKILGETSKALGVREGDILLNINGNEVSNTQKIYTNPAYTRREGDGTTWIIWRDKKQVTLKGKMLPKPRERSDEFEIVYDQFPFQGGQIRCVISKPKTPGKKPAILSIQGYPCSSIDLMPAWHPGKQIADEFTRRGYIVMRAEKPGVGDCQGTPDCYDIDFSTEVASFIAAFQKMKSLPDVDTTNLFIFGHSMGGMEAPFIANAVQPKGIIVYGVTIRTWYEYLLEMLRFQNPNFGIDYVEMEKEQRIYATMLSDLVIKNKKPSELIDEHPEYKPLLERDFQHMKGDDFIATRGVIFSQSLNNANSVEAWSKISSYVLSAHGEYDIQVMNDFSHREIVNIVNHYHPGKAPLSNFRNQTICSLN